MNGQPKQASSEAKYRDLVHSANSIILRLDPAGKITLFNEFAQRLFGYTEKEMIGRPLVGTIVPESTGGDLAAMVEGIGQRPQWYATTESECIARDGMQVWVAWTNRAVLDQKGQVREILCVGNDISPRKQAERELEALVQLHESILATMPSSVLVLDRVLNILMANRRYLEQRDAQAADIVGKNITDVFPAQLLAEQSLLKRIRTVASEGGQDQALGVRHVSNDHAEKYLNFWICAIPLAEGALTEPRVLMVFEDVTDRTILEENVRQASKLESIGSLANGIAHDFNNMLTTITGYSDLLLGEMGNGHPARSDVRAIKEAAERAASLTQELLSFGRRQPVQPATLDPNRLIESVAEMLQRVIGEDIELEFVSAPDLGHIRADPAQIEQVLINLAVNAREAMPNGGRLTIETSNVAIDERCAGGHPAAASGRYVVLAVADSGCGMGESVRRHVFEPFFTTKEAGVGTGLGLATVHGIVKEHDGYVWVYSEPGKGTTFKVYLPRTDDEVEPQPQDESPSATDSDAPTSAGTILVVEDEESVRRVVARALTSRGYTVLAAAQADEAEEVFAEKRDEIVLLFTDVVMPGRNGPALYQSLAAECPSLKVLYMSGYSDVASHRGGTLPPDSPFIAKPFTTEQLVQKVREVLGQ